MKKNIKAQTASNQSDWSKVESELKRQVAITYDAFHLFGKNEKIKAIPETLEALGATKDTAFTGFLISYYVAVETLGPGLANKVSSQYPASRARRHSRLKVDGFNTILNAALLAFKFTGNTDVTGMERVKSYLNEDSVGSFLFELAECILTNLSVK